MPDADHQTTLGGAPDGARPAPTHTVVIPPEVQMVTLLGPRDELLRTMERAFPQLQIHVRGQRVPPVRPERRRRAGRADHRRAAPGHRGRPAAQPRRRRALDQHAARADDRAAGRRADDEHRQQPRPHDPAQDAEPEALRRRDRPAHDRVRHRPGRHRQDLPGDGQGGRGAAGQAGQPDHPDPSRGRGRRAAGVPARHAQRQDRPLPAAALRRAARHGRPRVDPAADGGRAPSRWRRWPTCAAARSTTRSSSSTRRRTPRPSR